MFCHELKTRSMPSLFFNHIDSVLYERPYCLAICVLDFTFLSTSSKTCHFVSIDTGLRLLAIAIFDYWSCLVEVWGRDPWLSPIGHSYLVLTSVIMMMCEMAVVYCSLAYWLYFIVEVWGRDPWLSPIGHSHLVLVSGILMMAVV